MKNLTQPSDFKRLWTVYIQFVPSDKKILTEGKKMNSGLSSQLQYTFLYLCKSSKENQCPQCSFRSFTFIQEVCNF